ncbi:nuclear pore complex protein Nup93-like [Mytilus californianus]|uniref:nuclear pore complex protein Nup93-like n=1 Tax=Mytilus californianus TaxID=6549 RepID=UPI002245818C|nr:nuclear pore complex protein Nup93-like [Mytilus californianus]
MNMDIESDNFSDLQQQAEQLTAEMESGTDLPRVTRNLAQILEAGERLLSKVAPISQDSSDVKASILLGTKGFDVPKISQKLEGLSAAKTFEPLEPVRDTDIQSFLKNERENALLAVIEQTRKNTFDEVERRHWECMENEWEREKQKILNSLRGLGQDTVDFQPESESFLAEPVSIQGRSNLDNIEMAYARQVYVYNEHVVAGSIRPNLGDMFLDVARTIDDKQVTELWEMVKCMVEVPLISAKSIKDTRQDYRTQSAFVDKAREYLEQTYAKYIDITISSNLQQAQRGGIPGTYNIVRSFLNVRPPNIPNLEDGLVDGHPTWAMVYYCLRCGDLQAAQQVVDKCGHNLGDFKSFMHEYVSSEDHRLSSGSETKIQLQYRRIVKNGTDPFKRAVYCVIGHCDPDENHPEIADKIDDYLWLKLRQVQTDNDDQHNQENFTLKKLQCLLYEEFGENYFSGYQQPFLYFQVLILTAQFEAAIEFISRIDKLLCHAVHVALVLYESNMLLLPQSNQAQLLTTDTSDDGCMRRLNFARLITLYTRKFESTDAREALQYFYFLRDLKTAQGENFFMSCVSELVLDTREFEMLLGKIERDGTKRPGAIDKFHGDTHKIIDLVAKDTEAKGLFEDAVRLYDLAKKHDKVLELLNKLLSQVVSQASSTQSSRDRLRSLAFGIAERYRAQGAEGNLSNASTFFLLLDLLTFFDCFHDGSMDEALTVIKQLQLLPLTENAVETKVMAFRHYNDEVRRCLPDILLATMNILHSQYKNAKTTTSQSPYSGWTGRGEDGGKETYLNYIRGQAKALIMFAGMLPYRLPGDTNARLVQIEVLMN